MAFFILATFFPKLCDEDDDDDDDGGGARFQLVIYASCRFVPLFNSKKIEVEVGGGGNIAAVCVFDGGVSVSMETCFYS